MPLILYFLRHIFSVIILDKRFIYAYSLISIGITCYLFFNLTDRYDIISYTDAVNFPQIFEPFFGFSIRLFSLFSKEPRTVVLLIQFTVGFSLVALLSFFKKNYLINFCFTVTSVYFILTVANNLRQGWASVFILYGILFLLNSKKLYAILFLVLSFLTHFSSSFFIVFIGLVFFLLKRQYIKFTLRRLQLVSILVGSIVFFSLFFVLEYTRYSDYYQMTLTLGNERTPLWLKIIPLTFIFLFIEAFFFFKIKTNFYIDFIRLLRLSLISLLLFLAFFNEYDEIGARIMFFYFAIELLFQLILMENNLILPSVILNLSYVLALNAWNIFGLQ